MQHIKTTVCVCVCTVQYSRNVCRNWSGRAEESDKYHFIARERNWRNVGQQQHIVRPSVRRFAAVFHMYEKKRVPSVPLLSSTRVSECVRNKNMSSRTKIQHARTHAIAYPTRPDPTRLGQYILYITTVAGASSCFLYYSSFSVCIGRREKQQKKRIFFNFISSNPPPHPLLLPLPKLRRPRRV